MESLSFLMFVIALLYGPVTVLFKSHEDCVNTAYVMQVCISTAIVLCYIVEPNNKTYLWVSASVYNFVAFFPEILAFHRQMLMKKFFIRC